MAIQKEWNQLQRITIITDFPNRKEALLSISNIFSFRVTLKEKNHRELIPDPQLVLYQRKKMWVSTYWILRSLPDLVPLDPISGTGCQELCKEAAEPFEVVGDGLSLPGVFGAHELELVKLLVKRGLSVSGHQLSEIHDVVVLARA